MLFFFRDPTGRLAAASPGRTVTRFDHAMLDEVVDQRSRTGGQVFRHRFAGQLASTGVKVTGTHV